LIDDFVLDKAGKIGGDENAGRKAADVDFAPPFLRLVLVGGVRLGAGVLGPKTGHGEGKKQSSLHMVPHTS
jgi:hypothetical protein